MTETSLAVEMRSETGKGAARKLRSRGQIPATLYGHGNQPHCLSVGARTLERLLKASDAGMNTLIHLEGASEVAGKLVMLKELQREAVRGAYLHADLFEIDPHERVVVNVPVHTVGSAAGELVGGLVDHAHREVELECLVTAIPDDIKVDISALELGDSIHASDLVLPAGVELKTDPTVSMISIVAPTKAVEDEVAEEVAEGEVSEGAEGADGEAKPEEGDEKSED